MGRKHNELICKLNVSLDSVLVHTFEDFTIFFFKPVDKVLGKLRREKIDKLTKAK